LASKKVSKINKSLSQPLSQSVTRMASQANGYLAINNYSASQ